MTSVLRKDNFKLSFCLQSSRWFTVGRELQPRKNQSKNINIWAETHWCNQFCVRSTFFKFGIASWVGFGLEERKWRIRMSKNLIDWNHHRISLCSTSAIRSTEKNWVRSADRAVVFTREKNSQDHFSSLTRHLNSETFQNVTICDSTFYI